MVGVELPRPVLLLRCGVPPAAAADGRGSGSEGWQQVELGGGKEHHVVWEVPAGDLRHAPWVAWATAGAVLAGAAAVLAPLLRGGAL